VQRNVGVVDWGGGREKGGGSKTICTHVSKCKNDKIKNKEIKSCFQKTNE
jgi:hypothetical protein